MNVQAYEQTLPLPPVQIGLMTKYQHDVGPDGRFEIKGLIPGYSYAIAGLNNVDPVRAYSNDLVKGIKLASGEVRDLGDVVLRPPTPVELKARSLSAPPPRALSPQPEKSPKPQTAAR